MSIASNVMDWMRGRGLTLSNLRRLHPAIDRAMQATRRRVYIERFMRAGPRRSGTSTGRTFVIFNHCYDLDVEAFCAASTPHTLWVLDPFQLFTDVWFFFPPEQRDLNCVYGAGAMRDSIARLKDAWVRAFAKRLVRDTKLDALITPADTFYYLRPLIEELAGFGVPTIVQDKEGTIVSSDMMEQHGRQMAERYPPVADLYLFWNERVREYWRRIGLPDARARVLGQPRSDFFFHPERWPTKSSLGLSEGKRLVVAFTYDADVYLRTTERLPDRPWKRLRDATHLALRDLARARPDVEVVIKAHPQQEELDEVLAEFAADPLPNVRVLAGAATASHLIVNADVVVGFQSTVMIEAMLTSKPVIYAGWGREHDQRSADLIPIHTSGGCMVPRDQAHFTSALRDALDGQLAPSPEMQRARKALADQYFHDADGEVSRRVLDAVADYTRAASRTIR